MTGWQSTTSPVWKVRTLVALPCPLNFLFKKRPSLAPTIRSVIPGKPAAQRRNEATLGRPRRGTANCTAIALFLLLVLVVGIDDARDQRMAHHVLRAELG